MSRPDRNETKRQAMFSLVRAECRGCGREFVFRARNREIWNAGGAIGRCRACGTTTRSDNELTPSDEEWSPWN